jgi:hypothetical protein
MDRPADEFREQLSEHIQHPVASAAVAEAKLAAIVRAAQSLRQRYGE